jgi:hypothetical protein
VSTSRARVGYLLLERSLEVLVTSHSSTAEWSTRQRTDLVRRIYTGPLGHKLRGSTLHDPSRELVGDNCFVGIRNRVDICKPSKPDRITQESRF